MGVIGLHLQKHQTQLVFSLSTIILLAVPGGNGKKKLKKKRNRKITVKTVGQLKHEDGTEGCTQTNTEDAVKKRNVINEDLI